MSKKNEKESDAVFNPIILCVFTRVEETNEKKGRLDQRFSTQIAPRPFFSMI
jgi:hypothetical protein